MFEETKGNIKDLSKGAYVLTQTNEKPDIILIATGSEVSLAVNTKAELEKEHVSVRIVAMPSWELFNDQSKDYQELVLPPSITKRLSLEMGISLGWERYVGSEGKIVSIDSFGASGTGADVMKFFGFTAENVVRITKSLIDAYMKNR